MKNIPLLQAYLIFIHGELDHSVVVVLPKVHYHTFLNVSIFLRLWFQFVLGI